MIHELWNFVSPLTSVDHRVLIKYFDDIIQIQLYYIEITTIIDCYNLQSIQVPAAEVVKFYIPKLVDLHNYPPANSISQKLYNWNTLNRKLILLSINFNL